MALGIMIMRSPYTPYSIYLRGTISLAVVFTWSSRVFLVQELEDMRVWKNGGSYFGGPCSQAGNSIGVYMGVSQNFFLGGLHNKDYNIDDIGCGSRRGLGFTGLGVLFVYGSIPILEPWPQLSYSINSLEEAYIGDYYRGH